MRSIENKGDHLIIEVEVDEGPSACPFCGSVTPPYHFGYRSRCITDLPIRMQPVQICVRRRRYRCRDCAGTFLDQLRGIHCQHDATERLVEYVQSHAMALTGTFTSLACAMGVSEYFIRDIFAANVEQLERDYVIQTPRYMGIDEIYVEDAIYCVLTDLERRCIVDLLPKRDMETVKCWLAALKFPETVEAVTMDLWNPFFTGKYRSTQDNTPMISTARAVSALTSSSLCFNRKPCFPTRAQCAFSTSEIEEPFFRPHLQSACFSRAWHCGCIPNGHHQPRG